MSRKDKRAAFVPVLEIVVQRSIDVRALLAHAVFLIFLAGQSPCDPQVRLAIVRSKHIRRRADGGAGLVIGGLRGHAHDRIVDGGEVCAALIEIHRGIDVEQIHLA